jgi:uncharacterized protein HemX
MTKNQIYGLVAVVVLALGTGTYYFMGSKKECCKEKASCEAMTDTATSVSDSTKVDTAAVDTKK